MRISLLASLKEWVQQQIEQGGFGTASEYLRQLLREEQLRQRRLAVEAKLLDALKVRFGAEAAMEFQEALQSIADLERLTDLLEQPAATETVRTSP